MLIMKIEQKMVIFTIEIRIKLQFSYSHILYSKTTTKILTFEREKWLRILKKCKLPSAIVATCWFNGSIKNWLTLMIKSYSYKKFKYFLQNSLLSYPNKKPDFWNNVYWWAETGIIITYLYYVLYVQLYIVCNYSNLLSSFPRTYSVR